jgi:hypothetical protein
MFRPSFMFFAVAMCACGGSGQKAAAPVRSPTLDYPLPEAQTSSNGEVLGADRQAPGDKLREGPRAGTAGVVPAETPGGTPEQSSVGQKPTPCNEIGLVDESGNSKCKKPAPKQQ